MGALLLCLRPISDLKLNNLEPRTLEIYSQETDVAITCGASAFLKSTVIAEVAVCVEMGRQHNRSLCFS